MFVWIWLPGSTEPVVCGRLDEDDRGITFGYARSYLARTDRVPVYEWELPLRPGPQRPASGTRLPLCVDDALPDSWGRRLVEHRRDAVGAELHEFVYLLESGSDRIGALDFQASPDEYVARSADHPSLDDLATASDRVDRGEPVGADLRDALLRGTSVGGARPKALLSESGRHWIAKFSSSTDRYPVVEGEFVAMRLARHVGIDVAFVKSTEALGRKVLLVERFDRDADGHRHRIVSALTILGLTSFPEGRYATYVDLADQIRAKFADPDRTLRELFGRISFNMLCSNTDDHGRNHAALLHDDSLRLTPAYDICPHLRSGETAQQALAYDTDGTRVSNVWRLVDAAANYHLDRDNAVEIVESQIDVIREQWHNVCDEAALATAERDNFWGHQFMNPATIRR